MNDRRTITTYREISLIKTLIYSNMSIPLQLCEHEKHTLSCLAVAWRGKRVEVEEKVKNITYMPKSPMYNLLKRMSLPRVGI